jgi:poly(hydroxyalkanoate) granule-associated protein
MTMGEKKKMEEESLGSSAHKIWLAGLGALRVAEEEGSKLFKTLVAKGEELEERGKERLGEVRHKVEESAHRAKEGATGAWDRVGSTLDQQVSEVLRRMGVPTRDEIGALSRRVEELTRAVERLRKEEKAGSAKAPTGGATKKVKTAGDVTRTTETVSAR